MQVLIIFRFSGFYVACCNSLETGSFHLFFFFFVRLPHFNLSLSCYFWHHSHTVKIISCQNTCFMSQVNNSDQLIYNNVLYSKYSKCQSYKILKCVKTEWYTKIVRYLNENTCNFKSHRNCFPDCQDPPNRMKVKITVHKPIKSKLRATSNLYDIQLFYNTMTT